MTREDLFLAIGEVEGSRLARTELTVQEPSADLPKEESQMTKKRVRAGRLLRNTVAAVLLVFTLATTACAVVGYVIFDGPEEMIASIFGDQTGFDHSDGSITPFEDGINVIIEPTFDRVPVDEKAAAELETLVSPVGQSISWEGYTLTIDANMYDAITKCGLLTYTLENPDGVDYSLQSTGEVWFPGGEVVDFSQYGYSYIIEEKSTDTKLAATYYYQLRDQESTDLEITFSQWAVMTVQEYQQNFADMKQQIKQEVSEEEVIEYLKQKLGEEYEEMEANLSREEIIGSGYDAMVYEKMDELAACPDKITIPEQAQGEMANITLGDGAAILSPIAITLKMQEIENFPNQFFGLVKILFADGTEYVVKDDYILNHVFAVGDSEGKETTYMFNRIIDVKEVVSVIVDGNIELTVD